MRDNVFIHPSSEVHESAIIEKGTKIWNNVQVRELARIGVDCIISKSVYIDIAVTIGDRCKIQNGVSLYNGVTLEDDVFVGPSAAFTNDRLPRAFNRNWEVIPTLIKRGASIGSNATIICGITIGEYAMIAAGSVVTKDVAPYSLVIGNPARHRYFIDKDGKRIDG